MPLRSLHNRRGFFSDYWLGSVSGRRDSAAPRLTTAQFERLLHRVEQLVERVNGAEAPDLTRFRERFARPLLEDVFGFRLGTEQPGPRFRLPGWAEAARTRLFNHECAGACYQCLKTYRNQYYHRLLDKNLVRDALFQLAQSPPSPAPRTVSVGDGLRGTRSWLDAQRVTRAEVPTENTVIEARLLEAIQTRGRLPTPGHQRDFFENGRLVTRPHFAFEAEKIAIFCDGFAYHGDAETLTADASKRNWLQAQDWMVLTFWGRTILQRPERCEEQIWAAFCARNQHSSTQG
jgi:hypothetical protein